MKALEKIYELFDKVVSVLMATIMVLITLQTFVGVIFRYILHRSMGGLEELPVFMLIACVWIGGVLVAKRDDHVKIDLVTGNIKNEKTRYCLMGTVTLITAACSFWYTRLAYDFVKKAIVNLPVSPGIQFPLWYIYSVTFVSAALASICFLINAVKYYRRAFTKCS